MQAAAEQAGSAHSGRWPLTALHASIPHAWLLLQCAALLHPAGAGSSAAALLAGIPHLVAPLHFDQFLWVRGGAHC